jgi:hypothetical protein
MIAVDRVLPAVVEPFMRPRIFTCAALSAACSAAFAFGADPMPHVKPPIPEFGRIGQEKGEPNAAPAAAMPVLESQNSACEPTPCIPPDKHIHDDHLGPWNTVWVRGGYNSLWIKKAPASVPLLANNGIVVAGNQPTSFGAFSGISFDGGVWFDERHTLGLGVGGFIAEKRSNVSTFTSDSLGSPDFRRPFYNAQIAGANGADALIVSTPGRFAGSLAYEQGARVDGFDVFGIRNVVNNEKWTANFTVGFRYFDLDEYATVYQVTQSLDGTPIPYFGQGAVSGVAITDRIRTRNQFFGGQIGGDVEYRLGPVFFDLNTKAAMGPVHQVTQVEGSTQSPGLPGGPGGFLAVGNFPNGNQGNTTTDRFSVLADVNALIGVQVSSHFRLSFGYQFLYLSNVARPSAQFVSGIDPRLVPVATTYGGRAPSNTATGGPGTPPNTPYDRDDFFLNGLRFMAELQY